MVVVNQPSSTSPMIIEENIERAPNDHLVFTICSLVLCCLLGNWFALVCLIPALFLSLAVSNGNLIQYILNVWSSVLCINIPTQTHGSDHGRNGGILGYIVCSNER